MIIGGKEENDGVVLAEMPDVAADGKFDCSFVPRTTH